MALQHLYKSFTDEAMCGRGQVNDIIKYQIVRVDIWGVVPGCDGVFETILGRVAAHFLVHRRDIKEFDVSGAARMDQEFGRAIPIGNAGICDAVLDTAEDWKEGYLFQVGPNNIFGPGGK